MLHETLGVGDLNALQMWADPTTCLTVPSSGLTANCPVSVYAIAPPYVAFLIYVTCPLKSRVLQLSHRCSTEPSGIQPGGFFRILGRCCFQALIRIRPRYSKRGSITVRCK